jgi:hypothetical protein
MKTSLIFTILLLFGISVSAENHFLNSNPDTDPEYNPEPVLIPYLGISTGINYGGLLAITGELPIGSQVSLAPFAGLGTWGFKVGGDLRLYNSAPYGRFFSLGISHASGLQESIEVELIVNGASRDVAVFFDPVTNLNLGVGYIWKMGNRSRFLIDFGYALRLSDKVYYKVDNNIKIDEVSERVMKVMTPGGFKLGLGLNFGL